MVSSCFLMKTPDNVQTTRSGHCPVLPSHAWSAQQEIGRVHLQGAPGQSLEEAGHDAKWKSQCFVYSTSKMANKASSSSVMMTVFVLISILHVRMWTYLQLMSTKEWKTIWRQEETCTRQVHCSPTHDLFLTPSHKLSVFVCMSTTHTNTQTSDIYCAAYTEYLSGD